MKSTTLALSALLSVAGTSALAVSPVLADGHGNVNSGGKLTVSATVIQTPTTGVTGIVPQLSGNITVTTPSGNKGNVTITGLSNYEYSAGSGYLQAPNSFGGSVPVVNANSTPSVSIYGNASGVYNGSYFTGASTAIYGTINSLTPTTIPTGSFTATANVTTSGGNINLPASVLNPNPANNPNAATKFLILSAVNEHSSEHHKREHGRRHRQSAPIRFDDFSISPLFGGRILFIFIPNS